MNKLRDSICYLIGAIDFCENQGRTWRKTLIQECTNRNLGIKFLDPTNKLAGLQGEVGPEQEYIKSLKRDQKWDDLRKFMRKVVREDHRCVDLSDFMVMYIDTSLHMCGSYFELQSALTEKKPRFIIVNGGKVNTPNWLFGIVDHNCIFDDISSVVSRLVEINEGCELDDRWVLMRDKLKDL